MNLHEYKGSFLFKSPSFSSHSFMPNTAKLEMFTYSLSLVSIYSKLYDHDKKNKAIIWLSSHPLHYLLCFDIKLVVVVVEIGSMKTWLNHQYSEFHISNLWSCRSDPLLENFDFFDPLGFNVGTNSIHKTQKSSSTQSDF